MSGLSACQNRSDQKFTTSKTEATIVGGEPVAAEDKFSSRVIYLAIGVQKKTTPFGIAINQKGICTASALSSRILLTAAHCVKGLTNDQVYAVMTTNPWNHPLNLSEWIATEKIKIHEGFTGKENNISDDLALIKLSADIEVQRISKLADATQAQAGSLNLISVGYGTTSALSSPRPEDNENDSSRLASQATMLHSVVKTVEGFNPASKFFSIDQKDQTGVCQGDSGGPGYIFDEANQDFFILGVTSFASIYADEKSERDSANRFSTCIGHGNYTNLLLYKDWIDKSLVELK